MDMVTILCRRRLQQVWDSMRLPRKSTQSVYRRNITDANVRGYSALSRSEHIAPPLVETPG
eukprot:1184464-Prorocentrum_minimum.AAC.3